MDTPFLRVEDSGEVISLRGEVTTVGRGRGVDIHLDDPSVSRLHAELIRRGPYVYVVDLGLSRNGTRVNGRPVARRVLDEGDVLSFGAARCRIGGIPREDLAEEADCAGRPRPSSPGASSTCSPRCPGPRCPRRRSPCPPPRTRSPPTWW